ncbi:hypothetical protein OVZ14_29735 [Salmonella enterica subsp. enterica serovar 1,4,[5],12:i:-]|nr:hypothetical protein [Salmonella enterica subsp. enterica serovar 1,4,[5],12:i:-]MCY4919054.1 hypothetical protein [Salmonella enterica subsp. enterica serovar 1,4,[5],12:i:-]
MVDPPDKSRNDANCSLFLHFHKRWFGRRFGITHWCACSVALSHSANRLAKMQRSSFFC